MSDRKDRSESLEIEGRFWRPQSDKRFYGRINFNPDDGLRIHFVDTDLTNGPAAGLKGPRPQAIIHGEDLGGRPLTLTGFYPSAWKLHGWPTSATDAIDGVAERLLIGVHIDAENQVTAGLASCSLRGLREFLIGGTVDGGPLGIPTEDLDGSVLAARPGPGVELLLHLTRIPAFSRTAEGGEIRAAAQWTCNPPLPLGRLEEEYITPLQDLILFATRNQSYVSDLTVHPDPAEPAGVRVVKQPFPRPRDTRDVYALALNLADYEDQASIIEAWFNLRKRIGPVWSLLFLSLDRPESLLEDRLLGLLAFAEGYDRAMRQEKPLTPADESRAKRAIREAIADKRIRAVYSSAINHANSYTLRQRLEYMVDRAMQSLDGMWDVDQGLLVQQLSDTRNWLVHWGERGTNAVTDAQGIANLVRSLIVVLYVNLVRDLGLDASAAAGVIASGWRLEGLP